MFSKSRISQLAAYLIYHNAPSASRNGLFRASSSRTTPRTPQTPLHTTNQLGLLTVKRDLSLIHGADLISPVDMTLTSIPEVKAADSDLIAGRYSSARMNLSRAYDITSMVPDPSLRLSMVLRRAKLAQLTGQFKEEVSWYDMALGVLKEHAPLPSPSFDDNLRQTGALDKGSSVNNGNDKNIDNASVSSVSFQEFGNKSKAYASQGAKIGFGEPANMLLWNSVVSSRIIGLLRLGHLEEAISSAENLIPAFARAQNWNGLFCLHALKGTALIMKDNPKMKVSEDVDAPDTISTIDSIAEAAGKKPPASVNNLVGLFTLPNDLFENRKLGVASDPSREMPLPALIPKDLAEKLPKHAKLALRSFTKALLIAVNSIENQTDGKTIFNTATLDGLMHLQTLFNVYADSLNLPELVSYSASIAKQAHSVCNAIFPTPSLTPTNEKQGKSTESSEKTGQVSVSHVAPASPIHMTWCGPRLPGVNLSLLLHTSQYTASATTAGVETVVQSLKTVERHLPSDTLYLARALTSLARALEKIDPISSEGLYRNALSHLDKMPAAFEVRSTWIDAQIDYAHLLSLMSWNGRSRESEAVGVLRKVQLALEENPLLHPRHRQFQFVEKELENMNEQSRKEVEEVVSQLKQEQDQRKTADNGASEQKQVGSSKGLNLTSIKTQSNTQSTAKGETVKESQEEKPPSKAILWSKSHCTPLEYWIVERYSR